MVDRSAPQVVALPVERAERGGGAQRRAAALPSPWTISLVLVVGGGTIGNGVDAIYADRRARVTGFDIYSSPLTQFIADAHRIPLADASVDADVIQAVLEHVLEQAGWSMPRRLSCSRSMRAPTSSSATRAAVTATCSRSFQEIAAGPVAGPGTQLV
jgi:hypothetical protein